MSEGSYSKLCGGIYFVLLLEARKSRTAKRDNAKGKTDGLSQTDLLIELTRIVKPTFNPPEKKATINKNVSEYKRCKDNGGTYFAAVFDSNDVNDFDKQLWNHTNKRQRYTG